MASTQDGPLLPTSGADKPQEAIQRWRERLSSLNGPEIERVIKTIAEVLELNVEKNDIYILGFKSITDEYNNVLSQDFKTNFKFNYPHVANAINEAVHRYALVKHHIR